MKAHLQFQNRRGYLLYEVLIAVTIFALAGLGLVKLLSMAVQTSNEFAFEAAVRRGMESILAEARQKEIAEMTLEVNDEAMGVIYRTTVETLTMNTETGQTLTGLYTLKATATYDFGGRPVEDSAEVWIYKPAQNQGGNR